MVDTNSNPKGIQYAIPSNDDASKSISKIIEYISDSIQTGLEERKSEKEVAEETKKEVAEETKKEVAEGTKKEDNK
jgi:small subunit ribosomal protein S2